MIKVEFKTGVERKYTANQERKQEKEEELNEIRKENKEKQIESAKKFKKLSQDLNHKCSAEIPMSVKKNIDLMNEFIKKAKEELLKKFKTLKVNDVIKKKIVFWQYCKYKIKDEVQEIVIDEEAMILPEDIYVSITRDGYVKRISQRSYKASENIAFEEGKD